MHSSTAATENLQPRTEPPTRCGNLWLVAATVVQSLVDEDGDNVHALTLAEDGEIEAVGPRHPEYERRLLSTSLIGTVSRGSDPVRLAARIRDAALRQARRA